VGTREQWDNWNLPTVVKTTYEEDFKGEFDPGELKVLFIEGGISFDDTKEIVEYMPSVEDMMKRIEDLEKKSRSKNKEEITILTFDEDFLRGNTSPGQERILEEIRSRFPKKDIKVEK